MAKGFYTQALTILLSRQITLDEMCQSLSLAGYDIVKRVESSENSAFSGPSALVAYRPDVNGYVSLDLFPSPWPDHMGDAKTEYELFGAWSMGHFGPYAYPGGLKRAAQQAWSWSEAPAAVSRHVAVIRLRISYVFGAGKDALVIPKQYDPQAELLFLTKLATAFSSLDAALCCFNPNGELLLPFPRLAGSLEHHAAHNLPPLDLWSNIRLFKIDPSWLLMDSVGNAQLDTCDHEAAFPADLTDPGEVANFIRDATLYLLTNGDIIKDGDTMSGPAARNWQAKRFETSVSDPPREVLRWLPCDVPGIPAALLGK